MARHSRRSHTRRRSGRRRRVLVAALVGAAGIACVLLVAFSSLLAPGEASDQQAARNTAILPPLPDTGDHPRAHYPYSVVPGGVYSPGELADAVSDPVVAEHYAAMNISAARVETVTAPQQVHVSYRIGDRIYWTKRTVTLSPGERIVTDGRTRIRARCGNCISDTPQGPTSDEEPPISEFDRAMPPPLTALPALVLVPDEAPVAPQAAFPLPLPEIVPGEAGAGGPGPGPVPGSLTPTNMALHGLETTDTSEPSDSPGDPGDPPGPELIPIGGPPTTPQPVPIPEPGSMLLLGTGLAGGAWRAWRRRRLRRASDGPSAA